MPSQSDPQRHHKHIEHSPFGSDRFGVLAERFARFFGTPTFIIGQTVVVIIWIILNATLVHAGVAWDVYPFILLNLCFSTQAAYAAPLILLAQTRQAERDKLRSEADNKHREDIAQMHADMIAENTGITEQIHDLAEVINDHVSREPTKFS